MEEEKGGHGEEQEPTDFREYYAPPVSAEAAPAPEDHATGQKDYGCRGAATGGCFVPAGLFIVTAALGDTGGPLFWPMLAVPLAIGGYAIGTCLIRRPGPKPPAPE